MYNQRMRRLALLAAILFSAIRFTALGQSQPRAVIDTTAGRLTCTLFTHERPATTAAFIALAEGTKAWTAPDGSMERDQPFYDGTRIFPHSAGIVTGARAAKEERAAGAGFAVEAAPPLRFDRAGLLAMTEAKGEAGPSRFLVTDHANAEVDGHAVVFGECDEASVKLVARLRRELQATDNHPAKDVAIRRVVIVPAGKALPGVAAVDANVVVLPAPSAAPLAAPAGPEPTGPVAVIETSVGTISCRLFTKESPIATATFLSLVDGSKDWTDPRTRAVQHGHRFYDGQAIDRVLPDYYIQFGDITGDISGDTDIGFRFKNESAPGLTFDRPGRLAFGNGGPDTNNSELFFALNPMHVLDGGYTIIGQCDGASMKVLERVAGLARDSSNRPLTPVVIRRISTKP
ncbi:peptidyl-prolyl cis-trans isomerase cyclophilin type [Granulicella tundricola MP5ACTX9]|uniref:peptidylprolyl isomerase n=2 Tax=Granulicella TaxID=940557 RepID=E8X421_GRATM|nr:peptidyl-prolyl cis-trans isomerase cyclophilin type [Granulicella tundricola MP5ACTX9]